LAKQLAANRFNFPIIFMSGSDDERLRRSALDAGAVTFLSKPFRIEDLMLALSKAIVAQ
jgi:FixJ family two-component response regulator